MPLPILSIYVYEPVGIFQMFLQLHQSIYNLRYSTAYESQQVQPRDHHTGKTCKMHTTTLFLTGLAALAAASPMNVIRRQDSSPDTAPYPYDSSDSSSPSASGAYYPYPSPSGMPTSSGAYYPIGTGSSIPYPTGQASCPTDGVLVCNGSSQFGLCNFGQVVWQQVAAGTQCQDGEIVFAPGYGTAASGMAAVPTGY